MRLLLIFFGLLSTAMIVSAFSPDIDTFLHRNGARNVARSVGTTKDNNA
jgi:hypothetical protein